MRGKILIDTGPYLCHSLATMARPRIPYLRADYKVSLPAPLAAEVDLMLEDPLTKKPKYGARSLLIEALLREWLAKIKGQNDIETPSLSDLRGGA